MASSDARRDYDQMLMILSEMTLNKPVSLVSISQKTGIKLADVIRLCSRFEKEKLISRKSEKGNTYYILIVEDFRSKVDSMMPEVAAVVPTVNSREEISKRRSMRKAKSAEEPVEPVPEPAPKTPEPISAVDLMAIRRSSTMNKRIFQSGRNTAVVASNVPMSDSASSSGTHPASSVNPALRRYGSMPSSTHKAVYINRPTGKNTSSRSSFSSMPSSGFEMPELERSDTNFKPREDVEPRSLGPINFLKNNVRADNELSEDDIRKKLNLSADEPLVTILSLNEKHDFWAACSAMANVGGGTIILGVKKHGKDENANFFVKGISRPEEAVKTLIRSFNDRNVISDCPRDPSFIDIVELKKKRILLVRLSPDQFSPAPLYTSKDSFCARDTNGCFTYKNGEVVHCSEDEVKALWEARRLGSEKPDWNQDSVQIPVLMEHKVRLNIPAGYNDDVRPLSVKECTFGEPVELQIKLGKHRAYPGKLPPEREPVDLMEKVIAAQKAAQNAALNKTEAMAADLDNEPVLQGILLAQDIYPAHHSVNNEPATTAPQATIEEKLKRKPGRPRKQKVETVVDAIISAADIAQVDASENGATEIVKAEDEKTAKTRKPRKSKITSVQPELPFLDAGAANAGSSTVNDGLPPAFSMADRAKLDEIAEPAVEHSRLPVTRLCEIATSLLRCARLTPNDLAEVLKRKLPAIRDKVIPKLLEDPNVKCIDGAYYIAD